MKIHLAPSDNHKYLMSQTTPLLGYQGGDVTTWQNRLRRKVRRLLGDLPKERCALRPRTLWRRPHPLGTIEKVVFTAEPCSDMVVCVCIPKNSRPPHPFMICLQGHSTGMHNSIGMKLRDKREPVDVEGDLDYGLGCMRRGIPALCIEQRAFGERREEAQKKSFTYGCHEATMHALMLGRTLIGERVYDIDRGIDYLASRGDADMSCIGVMGNSGGGTISLFSAALLPRIAFAMPSGYFCTFRASVMSVYHCMDNYVPGLLKYAEMSDIMALFAPKPVVIVAGEKDPIFPISATRRAFRNLRRVYSTCGAGNRCHLVVGPGGHRFYAEQAWPVMLREIRRIRPTS